MKNFIFLFMFFALIQNVNAVIIDVENIDLKKSFQRRRIFVDLVSYFPANAEKSVFSFFGLSCDRDHCRIPKKGVPYELTSRNRLLSDPMERRKHLEANEGSQQYLTFCISGDVEEDEKNLQAFVIKEGSYLNSETELIDSTSLNPRIDSKQYYSASELGFPWKRRLFREIPDNIEKIKISLSQVGDDPEAVNMNIVIDEVDPSAGDNLISELVRKGVNPLIIDSIIVKKGIAARRDVQKPRENEL